MSRQPEAILGNASYPENAGSEAGARSIGIQRASLGRRDDEQLQKAEQFAKSAAGLRSGGDESGADRSYHAALELALEVVETARREERAHSSRAVMLAVRCALDCGEVSTARRLIDAREIDLAPSGEAEVWSQYGDVGRWSDAWLVAAVRCDPPDEAALDELAQRHWKTLFGRCQMLTLHREKAADLAQDAWCRVLRAHRALKPGGNFPAYIATIATNLWRDRHRSERRAGPLSEQRLASLDMALPSDDGATIALTDILPDLNALEGEKRRRLKEDLDRALSRLAPLSHDILVARYVEGESCAAIGHRYHRTEQTISAWVRRAVEELRSHLQAVPSGAPREEQP
jgi:RNA polymerase sigma-70 factor (ECF subfamily)